MKKEIRKAKQEYDTMVQKQKESFVRQLLLKRHQEMSLETFERHLKNTNRLYGTKFKVDEFVKI